MDQCLKIYICLQENREDEKNKRRQYYIEIQRGEHIKRQTLENITNHIQKGKQS